MKIYLTENTLGKVLFYMLLVSTAISTSFYNSPLKIFPYIFMLILDVLIIYHAFTSPVHIHSANLLLTMVFAYYLIRSIRGLNIVASLASCSQLVMCLTVFFAAVTYFDIETYEKVCKALIVALFPHTILVIIQRMSGLGVDHVGGLFGITLGTSNLCNNAFLSVCSVILVAYWLENKINKYIFALGIMCCAASAALAEIKFYFLEIVIFVIFYLINSRDLKKSFLFVVISVGILYFGIKLLAVANPYFANFFTIEGITDYINSGYGGKTFAVSRINGYPFVSLVFFENNIYKIIFGNGYGGDLSGIATAYHTFYFTYSSLYFAGGIFGSILMALFFICIAIKSVVSKVALEGRLSLFMAVIALATFFYDSQVLFPQAIPFIYFVLAGVEIANNSLINGVKA